MTRHAPIRFLGKVRLCFPPFAYSVRVHVLAAWASNGKPAIARPPFFKFLPNQEDFSVKSGNDDLTIEKLIET